MQQAMGLPGFDALTLAGGGGGYGRITALPADASERRRRLGWAGQPAVRVAPAVLFRRVLF